MWSLTFVQVPEELYPEDTPTPIPPPSASTLNESSSEEEEEEDRTGGHLTFPSKDEIVRRMSIASIKAEEAESEQRPENGIGTRDEDSEDSVECQDWVTLGESTESTGSHGVTKSLTSDFLVITAAEEEEQPSVLLHSKPVKPKKGPVLEVPKLIRTSKSDTALTDSFVLIDGRKGPEVLKPGHVWRQQLVFRGKLTMHTAFERKDNREPAAITAITCSKDSRTLLVGDARGRVFSWTAGEGRGLLSDHWVKDELAEVCGQCRVKFSLTERRHHCRSCGNLFCSK